MGWIELGKYVIAEQSNEGLGSGEIIRLDNEDVPSTFLGFVCFLNADDRTEIEEVCGN